MVSPLSIFLWEGKIQLGDEPGIYGNASYSGLAFKFPITIDNIDSSSPKEDTVSFEIKTSDVNVYTGYLGHKVTILGYKEDPANAYHWIETVLISIRITTGNSFVIETPIPASQKPTYISLMIEVDTTVTPGLYDDFIVSSINYHTLQSALFAKFGFQ